jgi:hypothetical protein
MNGSICYQRPRSVLPQLETGSHLRTQGPSYTYEYKHARRPPNVEWNLFVQSPHCCLLCNNSITSIDNTTQLSLYTWVINEHWATLTICIFNCIQYSIVWMHPGSLFLGFSLYYEFSCSSNTLCIFLVEIKGHSQKIWKSCSGCVSSLYIMSWVYAISTQYHQTGASQARYHTY